MFSKPNAIVYLRRNNLVVGGKHIPFVKQNLTPDLINNLEIINRDKFIATCRDFFSVRDIRNKRVLIVLDQSIVFSKTFVLSGASKESASSAISTFIDAMPFEPGQRVCVQLREDKKLQLYATNADLYNTLVESLRMSDMKKLTAITPSAAYQIDFTAKPSLVIEQLMDDKVVRQTFDFSTASPE